MIFKEILETAITFAYDVEKIRIICQIDREKISNWAHPARMLWWKLPKTGQNDGIFGQMTENA